MRTYSLILTAFTLILTSCSKQDLTPSNHKSIRFIHALTGLPLKGIPISIQRLTDGGCSWTSGCYNNYSPWKKTTTDADGYIHIDTVGTFTFQSELDSLWNPLIVQNPSTIGQESQSRLNCYLYPVTILELTFPKAQFEWGFLTSIPARGMESFLTKDMELFSFFPNGPQTVRIHLLRRVENQVKILFHYLDYTSKDTLLKITPMDTADMSISLRF